MLSIFKQYWWKLLAIPILFYAIFSGLMIPLGPGISEVSEKKVESGKSYSLKITGYNTHFQQEEASTQVWLRKNKDFVCANKVAIQSDHSMIADFVVPYFPTVEKESKYIDLVVNNNYDGTFALRDALVISTNDLKTDQTNFTTCQHSVKTDQAAFRSFPNREIIKESIRNLFYHVPMWFAMIFMLIFSLISSMIYLSNGNLRFDMYANQAIHVALFFGVLGLLTGMLWANFTWGHPWPNDPRLNGTAIAMLVYFAYLVLRGSLTEEIKKAKISSVYNIFAFIIYIVFIFVIPNLGDSLHPGRGENPAFSKYDLDNSMRAVFYPAIIGWTLIGFWIISLKIRITFVAENLKLLENLK